MRIIAGSLEAIDIKEVFLNGELLPGVVEMDVEENWARHFVTDGHGKYLKCPDGIRFKVKMSIGKITYTVRKE